MNWLTAHKLPVGYWGEKLIRLLINDFYWFFDALSLFIQSGLEVITRVVLWLPPPIVVALVAGLAFLLHRNWKLALWVVIALVFIINQGYWPQTIETVVLVLGATVVSMVIGVPVGIAAAHRPWLYRLIRPVLDLMQTLPTFVYLIPAVVLFGLGVTPGLVATVIFTLPTSIRLTQHGIASVPAHLVEAGKAFGASKRQLLWKVELPHARPTIMVGLTQCIMLSLSMVVIAALVGANGLGQPVVRALNTVNVSMGLEAGLVIVVVAIVLDRLCRSERNISGADS
ncbi:MAG: choline ABC transporter permease subunit [Hyphomicrobiales bacterium]